MAPSSSQFISGQATAYDLLNDKDYANYSADWYNVASMPAETDLGALFADSNKARITALSFRADHIKQLVSTPGATYVKVRFIIVPDLLAASHFSAVIFAADAIDGNPEPGWDEGRLSAYYLPKPYWDGAGAAPGAAAPVKFAQAASRDAAVDEEPAPEPAFLPHDLARAWIAQWEDLKTITPVLFTASDGTPLLGYNFAIKDFLETLVKSQPLEDPKEVRLVFGVREYYAPSNLSQLTSTFGLAVRMYDNNALALTSTEPFFDFATPCPPTH